MSIEKKVMTYEAGRKKFKQNKKQKNNNGPGIKGLEYMGGSRKALKRQDEKLIGICFRGRTGVNVDDWTKSDIQR